MKMSKSIKLASIFIAFAIFFTFIQSYLMKHKADLNYDRIINVINTSKFELEIDNFSDKFKEYKKNRKDVSVCKELYYKIIEVIEIYNKCNFIKNSMRVTPFPITEMWTNGIVLIIFFSILYMTFVSTDAGKFWTNKAALDEIISSADKLFDPNNVNQKVDIKRKKFQALLDKFEKSNETDATQLKAELTDYGKKLKQFNIVNKQFDIDLNNVPTNENGNTQIKQKQIKAYQRIIDSHFATMSGGAAPQDKDINLELSKADTETLRQYEKQYQLINSKLIYFNRDVKYVNVTLAVSILLFGSYFCVSILDNSRTYQNMLSSGGIFGGKDCL